MAHLDPDYPMEEEEAALETRQDLATLDYLDNEILLECLQQRYQRGHYYTYIADTLVAVNPCKPLPIYTLEHHEKYADLRVRSQHEPHIFWVADHTYRAMLDTGQSQCVVVSGDSGAGKTESTKLVLAHLVHVSDSASSGLVECLEQVNPLLELFGNASTELNQNSSRFGKLVELRYDRKGRLVSSKLECFILEKFRVTSKSAHEKNFHIFYALFAGMSPADLMEIHQLEQATQYRILSSPEEPTEVFSSPEKLEEYRQKYKDLLQMLDLAGFTEEERQHLIKVLVAVLFVSNVQFVPDEHDYAEIDQVSHHNACLAAEVLEIDEEKLLEALLIVTTTAGSNDHVERKKTVRDAEAGRDALARELYSSLFYGIIDKINSRLADSHRLDSRRDSSDERLYIRLLDISGFEKVTHNGFEQLLINAANERLHQYFLQHAIQSEVEDYTREGLDIREVEYDDNQEVMDLIFKKPYGLLPLMDEELSVPKTTDKTFLAKCEKHCRDNPHYVSRAKSGSLLQFAIQHYAGEVVYSAHRFLEKNRETLANNLKQVVDESDNVFITQYFLLDSQATLARNSGGRGSLRGNRRGAQGIATPFAGQSNIQAGKLTGRVTERFVMSLNHMMSKLKEARPVFIRCIKPNLALRPGRFSAETVRQQLESSGVLAVTKLRQAGFPLRLPFRQFCRRYYPIVSEDEPPGNKETAIAILDEAGITSHSFGHTKVFLKTEHRDQLERVREEKMAAREAAAREAERASRTAESEGDSEIEVSDSGLDDTISTAGSHMSPRSSLATSQKVRLGRRKGKASGSSDGKKSKDGDGEDKDKEGDDKKKEEGEKKPEEEKEETEINMPAYDVFRNTELESGSGHEFETKVIRAVRFVFYIMLTMLVLGCSVIARVTLQWLTQSLLTPYTKGTQRKAGYNDVAVMMMLVLVLPVLFTWVRSLIKTLFGRKRWATCGVLIMVVFLDLVQVLGRFLLVFYVLPVLGRLQAVVVCFAVCLVPALLKTLTHLFARRHHAKKDNSDPESDKGTNSSSTDPESSDTSSERVEEDVSVVKRVLFAIGIVLAVIAEAGAVVLIVLQRYVAVLAPSGAVDKMLTDLPQNLAWSVPLSLLCISVGWWDGFALGTLKVGPFVFHLNRYRKGMSQIRETSTIYSGPLQMALLVTLTLATAPKEFPAIDVPAFFAAYGQSLVEMGKGLDFFLAHLQKYGLLYLVLLASYLASTAGIIACRLHMQRFAFALPITLVPLGVLMVTLFCSGSGEWWQLTTRFSSRLSLAPGDYACIGATAALLLAGLITCVHIWKPHCERMAKLERLFTQPPMDTLFPDLSLALRRRHDSQHTERERKRLLEEKEKVEVHICATMWHETRQEMIQILKSLFRVDFDHCARRMAAKNFEGALSKSSDLEDMYHPEIHIIFDDAFTNDPKTKQRVANSWVKQLLKLVPEALASVAKGHVDMDLPKMYTTPHGGRITYTMPGGTTLNIHLKDKDKMRHRKRWSQIMYLYYILGFRLLNKYDDAKNLLGVKKTRKVRHFPSLLNKLPPEIVQKAEHTFLMALDGDVDFRPDAVRLLIDRMKKNKKVAAVCGRIHPIGDGPMVWYQQFEYAVGHWLQKAAEHVFGCVLCCPGCFSLFRGSALMDDNVMKMYTTEPTEARHYIQYEQGEDRWLCTLLLQQGWKIDYCAGADSFTYAPETFNDFYIQRRRWAPSTMANIMDLIGSFRTTVFMNDNISTPFMLYQFVLMASSILAPGTIVFMIAGSYNAVLGLNLWQSYLLSVVPVAFYVLLCLKASTKVQISVAAIMSAIYSIVMMLVTVGTLINIVNEDFYTPNVLFLVGMAGVFVVTGLCHPKELTCLFHGVLYYITVPSTFVFLTVFFLCNLNVVTWGTREGPKKVDPEEQQKQELQKQQAKRGVIGKIIDTLGLAAIMEDVKSFIKQMMGQRMQQMQQQQPQQQQQQQQQQQKQPAKKPAPKPASKPAEQHVVLDPNAWSKEVVTDEKQIVELPDGERRFWEWLIRKYLSPILPDKEKEERIKTDLISARNNVVFAYFLINLMFTLVILFLQMKKDVLQETFYINGKYEPLSVVFLSVFAILLVLQFLAMLVHRWGTLLHLVASAHINWFRSNDEEEKIRLALDEARRLQSEDPCPDYESDDDDETPDTTPSQSVRGRGAAVMETIAEEEPDYSDDEGDAYDGGELPYYERQFRKRFNTMRRQISRQQSQDNSRRYIAPTFRERRQSLRSDLYQTVSRRSPGEHYRDRSAGYDSYSREMPMNPSGVYRGVDAGAHFSSKSQSPYGGNPGYGGGYNNGYRDQRGLVGRYDSPNGYRGLQGHPNPGYSYNGR